MLRIVGGTGYEDDPAVLPVHTLQQQQNKKEMGQVVDREGLLDAVVGELEASYVLHGGIQEQGADRWELAGSDSVGYRGGEGADVGKDAEV